MGRRTNTAKWLDKQKRWQINVQKDGQRRTFTCSAPGRNGQRECNRKADAWLDEGISGSVKVADLWQLYLKKCQDTQSQSSYLQIVSVGENYILPIIGHFKIEKVTEGVLQGIIDSAYKHGSYKAEHKQRRPQQLPLSRKTLLNIRAILLAFIKWCRLQKTTSLRPEDITIPDGARYRGKQILQPDNLAVLFSVDTTITRKKRVFDDYIYAYRFQVTSGVRPGELLGLRVGDIIDTGEVCIKRSINHFGEITQGKNQNAIRSFIPSPLAKQAIEDQIKLLKDIGESLVAETPLFQIKSQGAYYKRWKRYLESNGLPVISPYELRHTFVSIAKYLPEGTVKALVGHSRSMDTFGQYGHALLNDSEQTAAAIGELFAKLLNGNVL